MQGNGLWGRHFNGGRKEVLKKRTGSDSRTRGANANQKGEKGGRNAYSKAICNWGRVRDMRGVGKKEEGWAEMGKGAVQGRESWPGGHKELVC